MEAPKSVEIHRKEIYLDIKEQNNEAANISLDVLKLLKDSNKN
ncbi:carbon storage regulator [Staphylococcus epidermidis]